MLTRNPLRSSSVLRYAPMAAAVLILAGCGSKSDPLAGAGAPALPSSAPSAAPTSAAGSTPAATPPATLAPLPSAAKAHTDDGAIAFTKYYFETLLNTAYQSGNVQPLVLASDVNCVVCRATVGDSADFTLHGLRPQGGIVSVSSLKLMSSGDKLTSILLSYTATKLSELNADGSTAYALPAADNVEIEAQVEWDSTAKSWEMRQIINNPSAPAPSVAPSSAASP